MSSVLDGYNGCVFAYGQTGTGKTYTMEGIENDLENVGIIPRCFQQIWTHINRTTGLEFLVTVRYLEIYMENIRSVFLIVNCIPFIQRAILSILFNLYSSVASS